MVELGTLEEVGMEVAMIEIEEDPSKEMVDSWIEEVTEAVTAMMGDSAEIGRYMEKIGRRVREERDLMRLKGT